MERYARKISTQRPPGMGSKGVRGGLPLPPRRVQCGHVNEVSQMLLSSLLHQLTGIEGRVHLPRRASVMPAVRQSLMADRRVISQRQNPLQLTLIHSCANTWISHRRLTRHLRLRDYQSQSESLVRPRVLPVLLRHDPIRRPVQDECRSTVGPHGNKALRRHGRRHP